MEHAVQGLFRRGASLLLGGMGAALFSFLAGLVVVRALSPGDYGVLGVIAAGTLVGALIGFRTGEPLTRYLVEYREDVEARRLVLATALLTDLTTAFVGAALLVVATPWVAVHVAGGMGALPAYWAAAATLALRFPTVVFESVARDRQAIGLLARVPPVFALLGLVATLAVWAAGRLDVLGVALVGLGVAAARCAFSLAMLARLADEGYGLAWRRYAWREVPGRSRRLGGFWRFMASNYASSTLTVLAKGGDLLVLGYLRPDAEVGIYRLAKTLATMIQSLTGSLGFVAYQDLNELIAARDFPAVRRLLGQLTRWWLPAVAAGTLAIALAIQPLIGLVYGPAFEAAAVPFRILLVGVAARPRGLLGPPLDPGARRLPLPPRGRDGQLRLRARHDAPRHLVVRRRGAGRGLDVHVGQHVRRAGDPGEPALEGALRPSVARTCGGAGCPGCGSGARAPAPAGWRRSPARAGSPADRAPRGARPASSGRAPGS